MHDPHLNALRWHLIFYNSIVLDHIVNLFVAAIAAGLSLFGLIAGVTRKVKNLFCSKRQEN